MARHRSRHRWSGQKWDFLRSYSIPVREKALALAVSEEKELRELIKAEGENLLSEFHGAFACLLSGEDDQPLPAEVWEGIAAALADASGYRVTLESYVVTGNQATGHRTACVLEPNFFIELPRE